MFQGIDGYRLDRILDIYRLLSGNTRESRQLASSRDTSNYLLDLIRDPLIKKFSSFAALQKYALDAPDNELVGKLKVSEKENFLAADRT